MAFGASYHVSPSGSDAWPGTSPDSAWQTIARANQLARPGDVVHVWPNPSGYAHFPNPDSAGSNPTGGGRIAFVGASDAGDPIEDLAARDSIRLPDGPLNSPYTTLRGLRVQGVLVLSGSAQRCSVAACTISSDLHLGGCDYSVVSGCLGLGRYLSVAYVGATNDANANTIEDCRFPNLGLGVSGGIHRFITGSTEVAKCDSLLFARNRLDTVIEDDLDSHPRVHFWTQNSVFRNNVHHITTTQPTRETYAMRLRDSTMFNSFIGDTILMSGPAPAILYWSSAGDSNAAWWRTVGNITVDSCYINLLGSTGGSRMLFQQGMQSWTFRYNTLICAGRILDATDVKGRNVIDHNTLVGGPYLGVVSFDHTPFEAGFNDTMTFTNNIVFGTYMVPGPDLETNHCAFFIHSQTFDSAGVHRLVSDHNLYAYYGYRFDPGDRAHRWDQANYSPTGAGHLWASVFGQDLNSIYGSPLFADSTLTSAFDARLTAASPARGAGSGGSDIGAVAYTPIVLAAAPEAETRAGIEAWPNPARGSLTVRFASARPAPARARVLDTAGRLVRTLYEGPMPAGSHRLEWNGSDRRGQPVPPGVYFVDVRHDDARETRRVVLLR